MPKRKLHIIGTPGRVGGAATKLWDLIPLLKEDFDISVWTLERKWLHTDHIVRYLAQLKIRFELFANWPMRVEDVALAVCEPQFFSGGYALRVKESGAKLVWSNEMTWLFPEEEECVRQGMVDRLLYVSEIQRRKLGHDCGIGTIIPNYIDPERFPYRSRTHARFTIGRLSRADIAKYPRDFPVIYEEMAPAETHFRVMAWDDALKKAFSWHQFDNRWELLRPDAEPAAKFLHNLSLFVYPLGNVVESWGRVVVEAMLTGLVPVVPSGHGFDDLGPSEGLGVLCSSFEEFKDAVSSLQRDGRRRHMLGEKCAHHARAKLCNPAQHRELWQEALAF